jgi:copper chaperone NosL
MTLSDPRFAGEIVTRTGRVIPFDDVGCVAEFVVSGGVRREQIALILVHDFARPDSLLDVSTVTFLRSDRFQTPMDYRVVALRPGAGADSVRAAVGGDRLDWEGVLRLVAGGRAP